MPSAVKIAWPFHTLCPNALRPQNPSLIYSTNTHEAPAESSLTSPVGSPPTAGTQRLASELSQDQYQSPSSHFLARKYSHPGMCPPPVPLTFCAPLAGYKTGGNKCGQKWRVSPWVSGLGSICHPRPTPWLQGAADSAVYGGAEASFPLQDMCLEYRKFYNQGPWRNPRLPSLATPCDRKTASGVGPGLPGFTPGLNCPASTSAVPPARAWRSCTNQMFQLAKNDFLSFQGPSGRQGPGYYRGSRCHRKGPRPKKDANPPRPGVAQ